MKIHYHSECSFFAGCERMLIHFWASDLLRASHDVSFSFPRNAEYEAGLLAKISPDFPVTRLPTLSGDYPAQHFPGRLKLVSMALRATHRLVFTVPLLLWEIILGVLMLRKIQPDVLHLNNGGYPAARSVRAMAIAGWITGIPIRVMVVNNIAQPYNTIGRKISWPLDRLVRKSVHMFICGSNHAARALQAVLSLPKDHITSIPNGYNRQAITSAPDQMRDAIGITPGFSGVVLGVVALMVPRKGHAVLIAALAQLLQDDPDLHTTLQVCLEGDGPLKQALQDQVAQAGLDRVVIFVPTQDNIANFINAVDVLALPSIANEDFPNVVIEAMSFAKPVIASAIAGTPEQVDDGVTGVLVAPGNEDDLATALGALVANDALRQTMGQAARAKFDRLFTAKGAVQNYLNLYKNLELKA